MIADGRATTVQSKFFPFGATERLVLITLRGPVITVFVDGELLLSGSSSALRTGTVGFVSNGEGWFDDLLMTSGTTTG